MKLKNHIDGIKNKFDICLTKTQSLSKNCVCVCVKDSSISKSTMESTSYRHRRSPSSDWFLTVFSFSPPSSVDVGGGYELNEAEVFWTNDFTDDDHYDHDHPRLANKLQKSSSSRILAALPETDNRSQNFRDEPVLCQKPSISAIPMIPRPLERELPQALNCNRKFQNE